MSYQFLYHTVMQRRCRKMYYNRLLQLNIQSTVVPPSLLSKCMLILAWITNCSCQFQMSGRPKRTAPKPARFAEAPAKQRRQRDPEVAMPGASSSTSATPGASSSATPGASSSATPVASSSATPGASSSATPGASTSATPDAGPDREPSVTVQSAHASRNAWWEEPGQPAERQPPPASRAAAHTEQGLCDNDSMLARISALEAALERAQQHNAGNILDSLSITVPVDLKCQIMEGKFIDLKKLLAQSFKESELKDDMAPEFVLDGTGRLTKKPSKTKSDLTIDQWTSAFNTYMSVYLEMHPQKLQGMLAYAELIRKAARDNAGRLWAQYDAQFRSRMEADPTRPWGMIDNQLWIPLFCRPTAANVATSQSVNAQKRCFYFNRIRGCIRVGCKYTHRCTKCDSATHGMSNCPIAGHFPAAPPKPPSMNQAVQQPFRFRNGAPPK